MNMVNILGITLFCPSAFISVNNSCKKIQVNPTVCICCGESMARAGSPLSRDSNLCASCSSLWDGMEDSEPTNSRLGLSGQSSAPLTAEAAQPSALEAARTR